MCVCVCVYICICIYIYKTVLGGIAQWIECGLWTKVLLVQFPARAHAWVAGQVPSSGRLRGNHTLMFLYFPFLLSKNKILKKNNKHTHVYVCVCVCVYGFQRERERERGERNINRLSPIHALTRD